MVQRPVHGQMHQTDLGQGMMDLWSICKADLQIVDMIRPQEGHGPGTGLPTDFGCVVAGKDPVAVDATCCRMVGLNFEEVSSFEAIRERGLGNHEEKDIEIRGRKIQEVFKKLWAPHLEGFDQFPEYKVYVNEGSCKYCEGLVQYSLERLKSLGEYEKNAGASIVLGHPKELPKGVKPQDLILMGSCTEKFRDQGIYIPGCPPGEQQPASAIMYRQIFAAPSQAPRSYHGEEIPLFMDYIKKKREKAGF